MRVIGLLAKRAVLTCAILAGFGFPQVQAEEVDYANVKGWRIFSTNGDTGLEMCFAAKDNGKTELRIGTNGESWQIAVPYYEKGQLTGSWGFDGLEDEATFSADGEGWAYMTDVPKAIVKNLKTQPNFSVELDRGVQSFSLKGVKAAMDKVEECVRNGGQENAAVADDANASDTNGVEDDAYLFGKGCPKRGSVVSENSTERAKVTFKYKIASGRATIIYWIDTNGKPVEMSTFDETDNTIKLDTFVGHVFVVKDFDGTCYGDFFQIQPGKNRFDVR